MLDSLFILLARLPFWPTLAAALFVALLCNGGFEWRRKALDKCAEKSPLRKGCELAVTLDGRTKGYTKADARHLFDLIGVKGRNIYALTQVTLDLLYPFVYGLLFAILLVRLSGPQQAWVLWFPLATVAFDLLENVTIAALAWTHTEGQESGLATVASAFTRIKWGLLLLTVLLVAYRALRSWRSPSS